MISLSAVAFELAEQAGGPATLERGTRPVEAGTVHAQGLLLQERAEVGGEPSLKCAPLTTAGRILAVEKRPSHPGRMASNRTSGSRCEQS
jgi:hypothetical protein